MTAPRATALTPSRSLAANLAKAHISNEEQSAEQEFQSSQSPETQDQRPPTTTPQHEQVNNEHSFTLEKRDGFYILPKCAIPPRDKVYGPVEEFVAKAVKSRLEPSGDPNVMKTYKVILEAIRRKEDPSLLRMIFLAIRTAANGSTLHQLSGNPTKHAQLLHVILRFDPFTGKTKNTGKKNATSNCPFRSYSIADAYFQLILALVSANTVFLVPAMTSLWKLLIAFTAEDPPLARTQRIHATLAAMTRLCPKGKAEIFTIIKANFPFRTRPEQELIWCYRQLFKIAGYVPSIQGQVLQFVIDKCLEMDVEIKIHDGGQVTLDDETDKDEHIFDLELDGRAVSSQSQEEVTVDEMADKLDALMLITFQYLNESGQNDASQARELYELCLPAFESSILITYRSKFVQFIIFYLCGLESKALEAPGNRNDLHNQHATLYREFCAALIGIIFDPYRSMVVRQCAACYLASFLSRAKFAEADTICESLSALLRWAEAYLASLQENSQSAADAREQCDLHLLFYTICQAAFYIMCFRGQEAVKFFQAVAETGGQPTEAIPEHLREVELDQVDISAMRWSRLCSHALQPLRYCLETVREEFLNIATNSNLLQSDLLRRLAAEHHLQTSGRRKKKATIIKTGATLQNARRDGGVGGLGRGSNPLDSFFPFDPYLLRRSYPFVDTFYANWGEGDEIDDDGALAMDGEDDTSIASDGDHDDESSSSDEEEHRRQNASLAGSPMICLTPPRHVTPREPWTETFKRSRAPSIENGSW